jgi:hypothetical protein
MSLVTTEHALWRYDNAFLFTNQTEVDFGIALVYGKVKIGKHLSSELRVNNGLK